MLSRDGAQPAAESVAKLVKEHPEYFDGTQVQASHILLSVDPESTPEQREEKKKKLLEIAKDIRDGKVEFAEAAKQHSVCPSSSKGGDLGLFTFEKMATPFSKAAFGAEVGTVTDIVETRFGYHIIKVTKVVEPAQSDREAAKDFLGWQVQQKLFNQPFETPIKITEAGEKLSQAAAAQPPMLPRRPAPKGEDF
jgi:peptidyl-prolyl cis-trans isomerase C